MDLRAELTAAAADAGRSRLTLYRALLEASLFARGPEIASYAVTQPGTGRRAVPAFLTEGDATDFWRALGQEAAVVPVAFPALAEEARQVGGLVLDPAGANLLLDRADLLQLAHSEIPGEFTAWLRDLGRLGRTDAEVTARLRRGHMHVITGKARGDEQRLYLLEKSDDGTQAVACFSSRETLAQFAQVRRLFEGHQDYAVALLEGERCLRAARELGAYLLIDPESPWETQLEPTLL